MRALESPFVRAAARGWFGVRRAYYRARYPRRLELGPGVMLIGALRVARGTRLVLGANVRVRKTVTVDGGGVVTVGANTLLNGCWLGASELIEIGEWCLISDANIADTDFHNLSPAERHAPLTPKATAPVRIGRNVWVGARAIVLKGTSVGTDSVVGSGAVVRGAVPEGVVVAGNPAVVVKTFRPDERTSTLTRADVPAQRLSPRAEQSDAQIPETGRVGR